MHFHSPLEHVEMERDEVKVVVYVPLFTRSQSTFMSAVLTTAGLTDMVRSPELFGSRLRHLCADTGKRLELYLHEESSEIVLWGYRSDATGANDLWKDAQAFAHALYTYLRYETAVIISYRLHCLHQPQKMRLL